MSHFVVVVALPGHLLTHDELDAALDAALAPYDENVEMPRYVRHTRDELIRRERESMEQMFSIGSVGRYLADPVEYAEKYGGMKGHLAHVRQLIDEKPLDTWTDEQWHIRALQSYEPDEIGPVGEVYSTYNPRSKWDWWSVGGRWAGFFKFREGIDEATYDRLGTRPSIFDLPEDMDPMATDCARKGDLTRESLDRTPYAYVDPELGWIEKGQMGWFGMSSGDKPESEWQEQYAAWLGSLDDKTWLVAVDAHI
ncbi:hypothetical protein KHQ86_gp156 [Gordonia phage Stormageddon]|uniref:Uncharacterized protein n=1 Tax=Gordonia phage Stormageddon TaxID=2656541 RepID=A0A649VS34_9CAUD|nr:hypothetical protein KHQ86_gp156 [Gordonia phage Stormageddon]QGJ95004.1 hypothetical protein SEA_STORMAGEDDON_144 [Gordonia phage Stormageddon]